MQFKLTLREGPSDTIPDEFYELKASQGFEAALEWLAKEEKTIERMVDCNPTDLSTDVGALARGEASILRITVPVNDDVPASEVEEAVVKMYEVLNDYDLSLGGRGLDLLD